MVCAHYSILDPSQVIFRGGEGALQIFPPLLGVVSEARLNLAVYHLKQGKPLDLLVSKCIIPFASSHSHSLPHLCCLCPTALPVSSHTTPVSLWPITLCHSTTLLPASHHVREHEGGLPVDQGPRAQQSTGVCPESCSQHIHWPGTGLGTFNSHARMHARAHTNTHTHTHTHTALTISLSPSQPENLKLAQQYYQLVGSSGSECGKDHTSDVMPPSCDVSYCRHHPREAGNGFMLLPPRAV